MLPDAQSVARQSPYFPTNTTAFVQDGPGPEQLSTIPVHHTQRAGVQGTAHHSRDGSVTRGRPAAAAAAASSALASASSAQGHAFPSAAAHRAASAQRAPDPSYNRGVGQLDTGLQRRASNNYGHHRQTSVIHGLQHSRNPSFNSPTVSSPLSPESLHNAQLRNAAVMRRAQGSIHDTTAPSFTTPMTPDSAHSQTHSIDSTLGSESSAQDAAAYARRRTGTSRSRRGHVYGSSGSNSQSELRTPGEFALHHLFHAFVLRADAKINQCLNNIDTSLTPVESACGRGADAAFDQLITALGHIARQEPKPLVDSLMLWRKQKGDAASSYKKQLYQHRLQTSGSGFPPVLPRRNTEPPYGDQQNSPQAFPGSVSTTTSEELSSEEYVQADARATISVYILCRVLVEIFEQSSLSAITLELTTKLEDIVFTQLRDVEPAQITSSSLRLANWRIYGELLGQMSRLDYAHVASRFLSQLGTWQQEIAKSNDTVKARELESKVEMLLHSMRNLHLSVGPTTLYSTCDSLTTLANLFADSHGPTIKQAYCHTFEKLLLQIADEPENVQNVIRFKEFGEAISPRLAQMMSKVRHWSVTLPVSILLLCLSPIDAFTTQWFATFQSLSQKLKDKNTRTPALRGICQLFWTYIHRVADPPHVKLRKAEEAIRLVIPAGKKPQLSTESSVAEAMVNFIQLLGYHFPAICFRNVINPLIHFDMMSNSKDLKIEQMEPEKMVIGIRSFLTVISDLERGKAGRPCFPRFTAVAPPIENAPMSPNPSKAPLPAEIVAPTVRKPEVMSSAPVNVSNLDEHTKEHYLRFCEILGKITILCDHTFGSSAVLNEKFAASPNGYTPKTPLVDAFAMMKKEDGIVADHRQSYYDLLHVAIQALPRCSSEHIPLNTLINLLCTGSAHVQNQIAASAAQSLKAIARQGHAQAVATAFPRFIFKYDWQYSTMSDEGRLGPAHIETTLTLYVDLLQIWAEQLKHKAKGTSTDLRHEPTSNASRALQLEMTNTISLVDEMEAYGLFFLCSQSRRVRAFAIKVLRLVIHFDDVLGKDEPSRVIKILEDKSAEILNFDSNVLSVAERSRLQKDRRRGGSQNTLIEICSSEVTYDSTLWFKGFPNLIRLVFEMCPNAVAVSRVEVCKRLALMLPDFEKLASSFSTAQDVRLLGRSAATPAEALFDQWKLYLIMACVTLSSPGGQSQSQLANAVHVRKTSRNVGSMAEKLSSARSLFSAVIPMLRANPDAIRGAVVVALGAINRKLYRTLLESLQYAVITCNDEAKARIVAHQRTPSSPQRSQMTERMRAEVTHIYKLTSAFLRHDDVLEDEWILNNLINYTRDLRLFLSDADIQNDWRFLKIRFHYCGLIEELYTNVNRFPTPSRWLPFESRKSAFTLMEEWCGFAPEHGLTTRRDEGADVNAPAERVNANAAMEKEKNSLRLAALSAMAALCAGPVSVSTEGGTILQFNLPRMLAWIDAIFATSNERMHSIGQKALRLLLLHNAELPQIIEHAIKQCYGAKNPRALESYFSVVTDVLIEQPHYPLSLPRILVAVIFTLGNENREIRIKSARLLRLLDDRQHKRSNLEEFDISVSDKTKAVYKLAQFEYSKRLAKTHPDLAFTIFSEFCLHFRRVSTDHQRTMVAAILPWLQTLELQVDRATNGPTAVSYMLLSNMLEITVRFSSALHNEVQALWQALATGPHAGNVQLVLDFIINLSLDRREQNFVEYAKQIVVYLSATPAGSKVVEFLLMQLVPKNMINEKKGGGGGEHGVPDMAGMPYAADLSTVLPMGHKQAGLSLGQVSLIFLVDLMVPPVALGKEDAIKVVHAVTILWDHYTMAVQEQAREMLVHLIHELVTTTTTTTTTTNANANAARYGAKKAQIEEVIEAVRGNESKVIWTYEDHTGKDDTDTTGNRVPASMIFLTSRIVDIFGLAYDDFRALWAKEALHWASICPVRHLACRSFQVFRCISVSLDSSMLADMLARLSNTIADEQTDYQTFSLEILTTLKVIIGARDARGLLKYPQLFWTTCACLNTIHEREFFVSLAMLEKLAERLDLAEPHVVEVMLKGKPEKWEGDFDGLQKLVYKGLKSADCLDRTLNVLHDLAGLPDNELVGKRERLLFNVLANLPSFLHSIDHMDTTRGIGVRAKRLADVAQKEGHISLSLCLNKLAAGHYVSTDRFLVEVVTAIKAYYFPEHDADSLIFMMGLLTNPIGWFRVRTMDVLCELIPLVDMRNSSISVHGSDLISPVLRLLQTEYCTQALAVLDHIIEVPCTPMDRTHLRMSMASGPARAIRKEYEKTQSLFGIPMASGWSIPMPAVHSNLTRNNVHAVFYTCGDPQAADDNAQTPGVAFQPDEGYSDSYFPPPSRANTMRTMETATDTNMGDLVNTLDSLDDFFDEPESATTPTTVGDGGHVPSFYSLPLSEHDTDVYDEHTAPILSRSLARASSSLSFQNGFDSRPSTSHQHRNQSSFGAGGGFSTQTSFSSIDELSGPGPSMTDSTRKATQASPITTNVPAVRPGLHARSITSPANQFPASHPTSAGFVPSLPTVTSVFPDGSFYNDESLSDSENSPFPALGTTVSHPQRYGPSHGQQVTPTSAGEGGVGFSFRRGMRRLTGGKSESAKEREKARLRAISNAQGQPMMPGVSPKVPRVPLEYLNGNGVPTPTTPDMTSRDPQGPMI